MGRSISGELVAKQYKGEGVEITGWVNHVPKGVHGFHVHENGEKGAENIRQGKCSIGTGGHFNPTKVIKSISKCLSSYNYFTWDVVQIVTVKLLLRNINIDQKKHGAPGGKERHIGDLGNIKIKRFTYPTWIDVKDSVISLFGTEVDGNILDRSIVIHEKNDDFTGKSGNAGSQIACGIISRNLYRSLYF